MEEHAKVRGWFFSTKYFTAKCLLLKGMFQFKWQWIRSGKFPDLRWVEDCAVHILPLVLWLIPFGTATPDVRLLGPVLALRNLQTNYICCVNPLDIHRLHADSLVKLNYIFALWTLSKYSDLACFMVCHHCFFFVHRFLWLLLAYKATDFSFANTGFGYFIRWNYGGWCHPGLLNLSYFWWNPLLLD